MAAAPDARGGKEEEAAAPPASLTVTFVPDAAAMMAHCGAHLAAIGAAGSLELGVLRAVDAGVYPTDAHTLFAVATTPGEQGEAVVVVAAMMRSSRHAPMAVWAGAGSDVPAPAYGSDGGSEGTAAHGSDDDDDDVPESSLLAAALSALAERAVGTPALMDTVTKLVARADVGRCFSAAFGRWLAATSARGGSGATGAGGANDGGEDGELGPFLDAPVPRVAEALHECTRETLQARWWPETVATPSGRLRPATMKELDLVVRWLGAFMVDIRHPPESPDEIKVMARKRIEQGWIHLWFRQGSEDDDAPVALAAFNRPLDDGVSIGPVYTPPEHRGHGFASNLVACMSAMALSNHPDPPPSGEGSAAALPPAAAATLAEQGDAFTLAKRKWVALFTDLGNPTSNKIYYAVGFRPIRRVTEYGFRPLKDGEERA